MTEPLLWTGLIALNCIREGPRKRERMLAVAGRGNAGLPRPVLQDARQCWC